MDLLVRASRNDHTVIEQFLAPTSAGPLAMRRQPIGAVVADANVAGERRQLARLTRDAGVPFLIDPLTPLFQTEQLATDNWASLPFARPEPMPLDRLDDYALHHIVETVINYQREHGATHLIPPYFFSAKRGDQWWQANLRILRATAEYLNQENVSLPVIPVLAASLTEYGPQAAWERVDAYLDATKELNTETVALSWSWNDASKSNEAKLSLLLGVTEHAARRTSVIGWRAGLYGTAMATVGAGGYETGIGARESLHYVKLAADKRPKTRDGESSPKGQAYVYLHQFGRSVSRNVGKVLLENEQLAGSLVCSPDNGCCPEGSTSMIEKWRPHTIRERARELQELETMPRSLAWRLHSVERSAQRASSIAHTANEVLTKAGETRKLPTDTFASLHRVASNFRERAALGVA
ncbi:hypothetical protein [Clavibacter michiganensis]|uniref:hypothetical protein n=1 Tax=Clavibacter michiganensis TaxID=28447 RepID=UPI000B8FE935|nr:hypothetical protein [Clavibacter michiganensis]MDO4101030.1 hypothetical protein [Clavibacter michiganensis]MDO4125941.1 hypothetical protein [Clavibacter michiganensis]MDO4128899.1 hypothetical protein [Clavibacter michiganensis]MDO4141144.1 hypothetical protein [Clavibacter michiganensis]NIY61994.1 hypothetical protein [Clavibacter michiganensis subsp. michiganensis]